MIRRLVSIAVLVGITGCASRRGGVTEAFPPASHAWPWVRSTPVWSGTAEQAAEALGDEASKITKLAPQRVWLARYVHDNEPDQSLTVRAYAFDSEQPASDALAALRPEDAEAFAIADGGWWTQDGVLFRWKRFVFDVFGNDPAGLASSEQAGFLSAFVEQRLNDANRDAPK